MSDFRVLGVQDGTACGYYRIRQPFDEMKRNGLDVAYAVQYVAADHGDFPIVVAQRMGYPGFELAWLKMWAKHKLVWETDDDLWTIDPTNVRAARVFAPPFVDAITECARLAHMVTVSTEPLAEVMRKYNPNVVVLPNHVEPGLFDIERPRRDRLTIGWAGGDSHYRDMDYIAPIVRRFMNRNPGVDFHMIGWGPLTEWMAPDGAVLQLPANPLHGLGPRYRYTPWSADLFDYYRTIDFDIGIAPLVPSVFNRSKSHIKALEYAALGIPVIASAESPYRSFVVDGVTGFLVNRPHEWELRLRDLVNDHDMRESMGQKAKEHARQFSISEGWRLWETAYRTLL